MRKHLLFLIVVLCMAGSLSAQKKDYVTVGLGVDYAHHLAGADSRRCGAFCLEYGEREKGISLSVHG